MDALHSRALCATKLFVNEEKERPLAPDEAMRVLREQTAATQRGLAYPDHLMYLMWGSLYIVGYLPLALSRGAWAMTTIPIGVALGVFFACIATGVAASIAMGARHGRGLRGSTPRQSALYGTSWFLAFTGIVGLSVRLGDIGVHGEDAGIVINGISMLLVGVLFMGGGLAWQDSTQFRIGAVLCVVVAAALIAGLPAFYWIMVVFAGGGLALAGLVLTLRRRTTGEVRR